MRKISALFLSVLLCLVMTGCADSAKMQEQEEQIAELEGQLAALESRLEELERNENEQPETLPEEPEFQGYEPESSSERPQAKSLREEISTVEEAVAYLDERFPELWMSAHLTDGESDRYWLSSGAEVVERQANEAVGRSCIVNALTYLLSDDMEIYTVLGFWHDQDGGCPLKAINCIRTPEGYQFIDPVAGMRADEMSRYGQQLPQAQTKDLQEYMDVVLSDQMLAEELDSLYLFQGGERIDFTQNQAGWVTLVSAGQELYKNEAHYVSDEEYRSRKYGHVIPENIDQYALSQELGGLSLTAEEARGLVDAEPELVKQKIKTAADLLMYMLAAQIGDNGGCYCDSWDGYTWHTNFSAKEVMERKLGNCGSCANLANYLLEGDYEQIGVILHAYYPGNGGGHVYNYIKYQGEYYILDYSWYIFANYDVDSDFPVIRMKELSSYGQRVQELYEGVSLVIAHPGSGRHLPNVFGEEFNDNHYYVPEGAQYTVLYESEDGYRIGELPFDKKYYDWNVFW